MIRKTVGPRAADPSPALAFALLRLVPIAAFGAVVGLAPACGSSAQDEAPGEDVGGGFGEGADGRACASNADCPAEFECRNVQRGEFFVDVCVRRDAPPPVPDAGPDADMDAGADADAGPQTPVLPVLRVVQVGAGLNHACAVLSTGGIRCWGTNQSGELGDGTKVDRFVPVDVVGLGGSAVAVASGVNHTCALLATGAVRCWGANDFGQLGDGTTTERLTPVDVAPPIGAAVTSLSAGYLESCVRLTSGGLKCWGNNSYGQLGDGTTVQRNAPVDVVGLGGPASSVTVGTNFTCALLASGTVSCWGGNYWNMLGDGTSTSRPNPVAVGLSGPATMVSSTSDTSSCALLASGKVACWGFNSDGAVGDGSNARRPLPVEGVAALGGAAAKAVGIGSCALLTTNGVRCWATVAGGLTPVDVPITDVASLSVGGGYACALLGNGSIRCWGINAYGFGDGTVVGRQTPGPVLSLQ